MDCCEFFSANEGNNEKCKQLQEKPLLALHWEKSGIASKYSPGLVKDAEILHRQFFHPIHVDEETGKLKPALFDDAANKGLSVNRKDLISDSDLIRQGFDKAARDQERKPDRKYLGFASTQCQKVRSIKNSKGDRAFCVYDTATKNDQSHADVCQIANGSKQECRSVRSKLYDAFSAITDITK